MAFVVCLLKSVDSKLQPRGSCGSEVDVCSFQSGKMLPVLVVFHMFSNIYNLINLLFFVFSFV